MTVRIYVEGGFEGSKTACRKAFRTFLEKVEGVGSFQVIASGDRASTYRNFCTALKQHRGDFVVLLVDAEEEVRSAPWQHLRARPGDGWTRPNGATEEQAQLMVQVMESWFLADRVALSRYYGQGFLSNSLPGQPNIELIPKQRVFDALAHATRQTQKGEYHKTRHGFDLLELIDPVLVGAASSHARDFFLVLNRRAQQSN